MKTMTVRISALTVAVIAAAAATPAFAGPDAATELTLPTSPFQVALPAQFLPPLAHATSGAPEQTAQAQTEPPTLPASATIAQPVSDQQPPPIPTPGAPDTRGTQTLLQLYDVTSSYDASYRAALAQVRASGAAVKQAFAAMLPQIGVQADVIRNRMVADINGMGTASSSYGQRDVGLQATQALYRPALRIVWEQSKRRLNIALTQLKGAKQDLIVRLAQAYFDVLAAQDTLSYLRLLKDSVGQQLTMAQRNFEIGNASVTDSREAQARLALTRAQEIAAENDLRVKQLALDQLVGQSDVRPRPLVDSVVPSGPRPQDVEAWVAFANTAPMVQQARLALDVAKMEVDKAKVGHWPMLDLSASMARAQFPNGDPMGSVSAMKGYFTTTQSVGLQLTWAMFSGGAVLQRQRETQALLDKAQADLDNALRNNTQTTRAAYFTLQSNLSQIQALQDAETASRTALEANQIGYQVGARTNIDVLDAQSQLFQTRRDLTHARYNALVGWLRLKQVAGTLTQVDLAQLNKLLVR